MRMPGRTKGAGRRLRGAAVIGTVAASAIAFTGGASGRTGLPCLGEQSTIGNGFDQTTLIGTEGNDVIFGTNEDDFIDGRGGDDKICSFAGKNVVIGGS